MKNKETERDTEHTFPVSYGMTVKTTQCYNDFNTFDQGQVIPNSLRTCDKLFHLGTRSTVDTLRILPGEKIPRALHVCPFVRPTVKWRLHDTARCITGCTTGCIVYINIQPVVQLVAKPRRVVQLGVLCRYSVNRVLQLVVQPVVQVASCIRSLTSRSATKRMNPHTLAR